MLRRAVFACLTAVCLPVACLAVAGAVVGCDDPKFGRGIGRPGHEPAERPETLPIAIQGVFAADADPSTHEVRLIASGTASTSITGLQLCHADAECVSLSGTVTPASALSIDAQDLGLVATAGAVAVVGADGLVHAHFAWGADPGVLGSPYYATAVRLGVAELGGFVPLPFPMSDRSAAVDIGGELGCADPDLVAWEIDTLRCPSVSPALRLQSVDLDADESSATLENVSGVLLPLYGVRVCQAPDCATFAPGDELAAGGVLTLHFGLDGVTPGERFFAELEPLQRVGTLSVLAPGGASLDAATALVSFPLRCVGPLTPEPPNPVRIAQVERTFAGRVVVENRGPFDASLAALMLRINGDDVVLPAVTLGAAEGFSVAIDASPCTADMCVDLEPLGESGEASLWTADTLSGYLAWGSGPFAEAEVATAAGLWADLDCAAPALPIDGALVLRADATGQGPLDYQSVP